MKSFIKNPIRTKGGAIFTNLGSGPVEGATEENAILNMSQFIEDSKAATEFERLSSEDMGDGRFAFSVFYDGAPGRYIEVQMPGLPLDEVRYMGEENQNIWDFPRLYVDGSSWVWKYAILEEEDWGIEND